MTIRLELCLAAAGLCLALATGAAAAPLAPADAVRALAEKEANAALGPQGLRAEVSVGRIKLPSQTGECRRSTAFVPAGARLWGRSHIGLRCLEGADWSMLVPVHVRVYGPALVTSRPLPAHQPIDTESLSRVEVELTRQTQAVVAEAAELEDRVTSRPIGAGQLIPLSALKAPQVIAAGDMVRVVSAGQGFSVSLTGQALSAAQDGQRVRVRTDAGKVVSGIARPGRVVEVVL